MSEFKKWMPSDAQRAVLVGLQEESVKEASVTAFCKDYLTFTDGKFSKIMNVLDDKAAKSYFDEIKDRDGLMADLEEALSKIPRLRMEKENIAQKGQHKLSKFRAVAVAVRECKNVTSPERINKYIAPTGGAKTSLRRYLAGEFRNEMTFHAVESRETWRPATRDQRQRSKITVLRDFCAAFGMRNVDWSKGIANVEDQIIAFNVSARRVMFIDEAEFFSAYVLNLIKLLTNKSRLIFVIACTPRAHAKWNSWYPDEADQISRRTNAVISVSADDLNADNLPATIKDAEMFFPKGQFRDAKASLEYIVEQAWAFGHYSTIARVAKILEKSNDAERAEVEKAVAGALKQMAKERAGRSK
ncbi:MAG TPA: hypothetical protein VNN22_07980 [Verrucomicrobiae bacterium]|nr:hypothetical protein [Verrucomicrobiae bacterium]